MNNKFNSGDRILITHYLCHEGGHTRYERYATEKDVIVNGTDVNDRGDVVLLFSRFDGDAEYADKRLIKNIKYSFITRIELIVEELISI